VTQSRYSLDDSWEKLRWAKRHFEILRGQIEPFEQRDRHTLSVDVDANEGTYTFHVDGLEAADPDWGLLIGDCVHNARSALDHFMVQLYARVARIDPREVTSIQFPIYDTPDRFRSSSSVVEARKHQKISGYITRLEELQPYNRLNPSIWLIHDPLKMPPPVGMYLAELSRLDNVDKHRIVHATWAAVSWVLGVSEADPWPAEFETVAGSYSGKPLVNGAEVGVWRFKIPLPFEWEPTQVEMKRCFPIEVTFDPHFMGGQPVLVILSLCLWAVEAVLGLFEPVFAFNGPPLPVSTLQVPPLRPV